MCMCVCVCACVCVCVHECVCGGILYIHTNICKSTVTVSEVPHLVVAGYGNIDMLQWRVSVTEGNHGDVHVGSLCHRLRGGGGG